MAEPAPMAGAPAEPGRSPRRFHFARAPFIGLCAGLLAMAFRHALAFAGDRPEAPLEIVRLCPGCDHRRPALRQRPAPDASAPPAPALDNL